MIYGLIPVGGGAVRLGLPSFANSKSLLPMKGFDFYNPIANHLIEKMLFAGAERIVFVHGLDYKQDIKDFYKEDKYIHILRKHPEFSRCLDSFYEEIKPKNDDIIFFGMPDTIFAENPYILMLNYSGIVCGLFKADKQAKVDRLDKNKQFFHVKSEKNEQRTDWFWGVIKFDGADLRKITEKKNCEKYSEIGNILNLYPKNCIYLKDYTDLGTWENLNCYWSKSDTKHREIERKYNAAYIQRKDFVNLFKKLKYKKYDAFNSVDYYFSSDNKNIEFVRYREGSKNHPGSCSDITIKNFINSATNRFELPIKIDKKNKTNDILYFLRLLGMKFSFSVKKFCDIFYFSDASIVMYSFKIKEKTIKILEVEVYGSNFMVFKKYERILEKLAGFSNLDLLKKSKYQIIKENE